MEQYLVKKISTCDNCQGEGKIQNPMWAALYKEYSPDYLKSLSSKEYNQIMVDWGIKSWGRTQPEKTRCPHCKGDGSMVQEVNLQEVPVVQELMQRMDTLEKKS